MPSQLDWIVTAGELHKELHREDGPNCNPVLVDVREPEEWATGIIPNSHLISLGDLMARALTELNPESTIVTYCAHGIRSLHALHALKHLGFENVRSLDGGIEAWNELGYDGLTLSPH